MIQQLGVGCYVFGRYPQGVGLSAISFFNVITRNDRRGNLPESSSKYNFRLKKKDAAAIPNAGKSVKTIS